MIGIKEMEVERKKKAYELSKFLIKNKPKEKTMVDCFKEVAKELGYKNFRNVSNIYHELKLKDNKRLENTYKLKRLKVGEFEEISRIIKEYDLNAVKRITFTTSEDETNFEKATLDLQIESEEEFSIVIIGKKAAVYLNEKFHFEIDEEYTHDWVFYADFNFNKLIL